MNGCSVTLTNISHDGCLSLIAVMHQTHNDTNVAVMMVHETRDKRDRGLLTHSGSLIGDNWFHEFRSQLVAWMLKS